MRLIALRMLAPKKQAATTDAVLATLEPVDTDQPLPAYSPPIDTEAMTTAEFGTDDTEWADVAFTITSDGLVTDIRPVRTSAHMSNGWLSIQLKALKERRYTCRSRPSPRSV